MPIRSFCSRRGSISLPGRVDQTRGARFCGWLLLGFCLVFSENAVADTPLTTLRHQTRETLRREAVAPEGYQKDDAVAALCDLYVLLRKDDRYSQSEMLQQDAAKVRRRLLTVANRREARLKREKTPRPTSLSEDVDEEIKRALKADSAEQGKLGRLAFGGGAQAAGGFDNGWQLVELIQRVIEPDFWDTQGGPGTVHYFAMRRVLVVRATSDVHEQIRELLLSLPR